MVLEILMLVHNNYMVVDTMGAMLNFLPMHMLFTPNYEQLPTVLCKEDVSIYRIQITLNAGNSDALIVQQLQSMN